MAELVTERVKEFAESLLPAMGLEFYDVQFRREGHGWVLRLTIDSRDGVTLDHCSKVSRELSDYLDVEDLINHAYSLEVSSPGIERTLRTIEESERFIGEKVRVKLLEEHDGQRVIVGELISSAAGVIHIMTEDGKSYSFPWETIKKARLQL